MATSKTIKIHGRVQGVGFRYSTYKKALSIGLKGYVKNLQDGSVFVEAEGDEDAMNEFIAWCRQGPPLARVTRLDVNNNTLAGHENFGIR